jgi:hypothetical protein
MVKFTENKGDTMKSYVLQFGNPGIESRNFTAEQIWIKGDLIELVNQNPESGPSVIVAVVRLGPGDSISEA